MIQIVASANRTTAPRRRVLEVFAPPDGGVAEHVFRLTEGVPAHGWDVEAVAPAGSPFVDRLRATGATVHELPFDRAPGPGDLPTARALRRIDREGGFDVVHAHSSKAGAIVRAALPKARRIAYTPHCFAFSGAFAGSQRSVYRAIERVLLRRTGALIAASEWEAEEARRELGAREPRLRLLYYGVPACDSGAVDAEMQAFATGRPLVGMVSVLREQKDPLTLVRAIGILHREGRLDAQVAIVGDGALRESVSREIDRLGLAAHVRLFAFGGTPQPHLRALTLFALPSLWESLPISVLEAMACGLPVVGTTVSGVPEAVVDGVTGRTVAPGSPQAMADAIAGLLADPAALRRAGAAGRERWEARFGLDRMIAEIVEIYHELALTPR